MITEIDAGLLVARFVLAAVFLTAGVAKLADRAGSSAALIGFGLPGSLAAPFGVLLPLVELTVAVALLPAAFSQWGVLGALVLLVLFVAGIASVMVRGREAEPTRVEEMPVPESAQVRIRLLHARPFGLLSGD